MQKLSDFLKKYPHARILDIGTGVGNFIDLISTVNDEYDEIVGIDILDRAIQAAMINFKDKPRIRFEKMDVLNMTFPEASFDIVCLSNSLHHLSNVDETFIAMKKVLKNGGAILINEMKSDNLNQSQMSHLLLHHFSAEIDRFLGITHYDTFSRNKILKIASESSGLNVKSDWDMIFDEPQSVQKDVVSYIELLDRQVSRLGDSPKRPDFQEKANLIKEHLQSNGISSATQVLLVLVK